MIKLTTKGSYRLVISKDNKKLLYLDGQPYLWSHIDGIGEVLSLSKHKHATHYTLAQGNYKIYRVKNDPDYVDLEHLELGISHDSWQGYLLLTGLPRPRKIRSKIVPTDEVIGFRDGEINEWQSWVPKYSYDTI